MLVCRISKYKNITQCISSFVRDSFSHHFVGHEDVHNVQVYLIEIDLCKFVELQVEDVYSTFIEVER